MSQLNLWAKTHLPAPVTAALRALRALTFKPDPIDKVNRDRFDVLNASCPAGAIRMRKNLQINVHPEAYESFQWFCWRSGFMKREYDYFLDYAAKSKRFLDVGACHGVYSLSFCIMNPEGCAVAVDPSPMAQEILQDNIRLNGLSGRIIPVARGAGNHAGSMNVRRNWHHVEATTDPNAETVPIDRIDEICNKQNFVPDLMKIDVEGCELFALQGADRVLRSHPPLLLEVHPEYTQNLGYHHVKVYEELDERGYEVVDVMRGRLDREKFSSVHHTFFTICTPRE